MEQLHVAFALPAWMGATGGWLGRHRRPIGWAFNAAILAYVAWQFWQLGFAEVVRALPTQPVFYLVYLAHFAATPVSERWIFRLMWRDVPPVPIGVLLRKRAMNLIVFGYSGDVWFYLWVRARHTIGDRRILSALKDSSILSGIASGVGTAILAVWLVTTGAGQVIALSIGSYMQTLGVVAVLALFLLPVLYHLRSRIFGVATATLAAVLALHVGRLVFTQVAQALQWAVVMPEVGFDVWLLFLTVQLLILQIPFVPNRDILFLAVGVQLTGSVGVDQAELAALLLATSLYKQVVNLLSLAISGFMTGPAVPSDRQ